MLIREIIIRRRPYFRLVKCYNLADCLYQWPFQEPKFEVHKAYFEAYVREYPHKIWPYKILKFPLTGANNVSFFHGLDSGLSGIYIYRYDAWDLPSMIGDFMEI